jgi:TetR/AcrR family transcriptional repressor of mexJK operon
MLKARAVKRNMGYRTMGRRTRPAKGSTRDWATISTMPILITQLTGRLVARAHEHRTNGVVQRHLRAIAKHAWVHYTLRNGIVSKMSSLSEKQAALSTVSPRRRGRPPSYSLDERRRLLLQAAERVFIASGYGGASMEEIARTAGMSKRTLYTLFPDKRQLFGALISEAGEFPASNAVDTRYPEQITQELRRRLLALLEFALSPPQVELTRLVISEAHHWPELAEEFLARGLSRGLGFIAECLELLREASPDCDIPDAQQTASALCGAAIGHFHFRVLLENGRTFPRDELLSQVDVAMKIVLSSGGARGRRSRKT